MTSDDLSERLRRYLPSVEQSYRAVREFTLLVFALFTLVSLALFWGEVAVYHDLPPDTVMVLGWVFDTLAWLLLVWIALLILVQVTKVGRGDPDGA